MSIVRGVYNHNADLDYFRLHDGVLDVMVFSGDKGIQVPPDIFDTCGKRFSLSMNHS